MSTSNSTPTFNPLFLHPTATPNPYIFILLNQPIQNIPLFLHLWKHATLHIIADGAANHLLALTRHLDSTQPVDLKPDVILGDLDSITPQTRAYYEEQGVLIERYESQAATDFTKCLSWGFSHLPPPSGGPSGGEKEGEEERGKVDVVAYSCLDGRLDQTFHSLHQLFLFRDGKFESTEEEKRRRGVLWLVSWPNLVCLLPEGRSRVVLSGMGEAEEEDGDEGRGRRRRRKEEVFGKALCGMLPLVGERTVYTNGMRWDTDWVQGVGVTVGIGLSTSNEVAESELGVEVVGGDGVVFTVEVGGEVWKVEK